MEDLAKVNRLEVVNWKDGHGRAFNIWQDDDFQVSYDIQDAGRTLKIFIQKIML